jgi:hypothetical protein
MNARGDESGRWPLGNRAGGVLGRWPKLGCRGALPLMGRAVGAHDSCALFVGRCPTLVLHGPLALKHRGRIQATIDAVWNGDSESANGAPPSQPGATPQEDVPPTNLRANGPFHPSEGRRPSTEATPQVKGRKQNEG